MRFLLAAVLPVLLACATPGAAQDRVAIRGYDPVAYFTAGRPVIGTPAHEAAHGGARWRFASAENRERFLDEPARYTPQYAGYCAFGVAQGYEVEVDPQAWRIVDGRLYLNYDRAVQASWEKDVPGHAARADANWVKLK